MRVAQVCPYSVSVPGGVQGQSLGLARALRRRGHEVAVLAPSDSLPPERGVVALGRSFGVRANGSVAPIAPHPGAAARTLRALRDGRFEVVHVHEPLVPGPALVAVLAARCPVVGTFHRAGESRAYRALRPAARLVTRRLAARVAVSEQARATAEGVLSGRADVLFNGVEAEGIEAAEPWPSSGPTVLFVGRDEPRKGLEVLLEAFPALPAGTRLWVVGEGPGAPARAGAVRGVEWVGRVSEYEKASRLKGADVLCAPSLGGESFGVVLLEAMAAGTAVVASDLPGYRAVARPGVDALLVPPGDPRALAEALGAALGDFALRARLSSSGAVVASSRSMGNLAVSYEGIYKRVTRSRAVRPPSCTS